MPLAAGTRFGPYEILAPIGAGGMGEVYRARDTRLDRTVAIKVLPEHLSGNPQLRERFDREAKAISSLSHPHICSLYDVGQQDGIDYLVMEHLEGETLAGRLKKGPLLPDQVLQYGIQITDALDTAHKHGVIHRDLKPGNIMLTKSGAKLLDFGLAKMRTAERVAGMTASPTQTTPLTGEGTILGTLQYMAPEQLEGKEADARTDIFALGAVIYEMAAGRKAFEGKSQASLISAIMSADPPPISTLQSIIPRALDHVVRTCLAKEPDARWQTAHDVLVELKWIAEPGSEAVATKPEIARRKSRELLLWALLAVVSLLAGTLAMVHFRERPNDVHRARFLVSTPDKVALSWSDIPTLSPDGRRFVFAGAMAGAPRLLWIRSLDSFAAEPLAGTEGAAAPFWSPDSRFVAFKAEEKLKKVDASGSVVQTLCDAPHSFTPGAWSQKGGILFPGPLGLRRVSSAGGQVSVVLELDRSRQEREQVFPRFLPDGSHFLYLSLSEAAGKTGVYLGSLGSKESRLLISGESNAWYVPPGFLVYGRGETLLCQPFDVKKLQLTGEPFAIADQVWRMSQFAGTAFSVADTGVLMYRSPSSNTFQLAWYGRDGKRLQSLGEPGQYPQILLSPDEKRLAIERSDVRKGARNIWVLDLSTGIFSRLTFGDADNTDAMWSPDGHELIFTQNRNGKLHLYRTVVGRGGEELVYGSDEPTFASHWWKDGRSILFTNSTGTTFYQLPLAGERKPVVLLTSEFRKDLPRVSSDEHWVAYSSLESGRWEVYVAAFPAFTERRQISSNGGCQPFWRKDGKELFYLTLDGKLMAVDVKGGATLSTGVPQVLFQTPERVNPRQSEYCVTGDGKRFILREPLGERTTPITVVLNWNAEMKH